MGKYLGSAVNTGAPRQLGLPRTFGKCLDQICELTGEHRGPRDPLLPVRKDAGVDVISWRPLDSRPGQVILLVQCAAGEKWHDKTNDINLDVWKKLVDFAANPVKALAFPSVYITSTAEQEKRWIAYSWAGGILLDRLRIASWFPRSTRSPIWSEMSAWCQCQIERLPWIV